MVYAGKHARHGSARDTGDELLPDGALDSSLGSLGSLDSLEDDESLDGDGGHAHMQRLLGSIHLQGVHLPVIHPTEEAEPLPDITMESLEQEESLESDGSLAHMQQLFGSIHLQGIRWQSPIYIEGQKREDSREPSSADHGAGLSEPDDFLRDDTVILVAVEKPPPPHDAAATPLG